MTNEDIIRMAREAGLPLDPADKYSAELIPMFARFAALAVAGERKKSAQLWMLLDDVDTADDIAKSDDALYRSLCRQAHKNRWKLLTGQEVDAALVDEIRAQTTEMK